MTHTLLAACIQTNGSSDVTTNHQRLEPMIREARQRGASLITLPENTNIIGAERDHLFSVTRPEAEDPTVAFFKRMAAETETWILAGSIAIAIANGQDKLANRSFLFSPQGNIVARYDKIHMFDAELSETETYRESANYQCGNSAVVAKTPLCKIGMTICYDVRFPHLYRTLAKAGASIIAIPAAFAATTGRLHWHVLTRARAIETGCFVIAPAQCGTHDNGRQTYGHSLIIAPDGSILAEAGDEPDIIMAELDLNKVTEARRRLPCLEHDKVFGEP